MNNYIDFQVTYDGSALTNHEMDIRDLAPALLAISDALDETNKIIYGSKTKVQVNIKGTFKTGSFGFMLSVNQLPIDQLVSMFASDKANAAANLAGILGFLIPGGGLLGFLLWLKSRKIKKTEKVSEAKTIVEVDDGDKYEASPNILSLFSNIKVRTSIQKVIYEPLSKEGIESFSIKKGKSETKIEKEDKDYFKLTEIPDELLKDQEREIFLSVVDISFKEGHKWKFSDGSVEFYATINDGNFIRKVQENTDGFYKDDLFKVLIREKQWISDTGIKSDYEIIRVLEHRSGAKQIKLPFGNDSNEKK